MYLLVKDIEKFRVWQGKRQRYTCNLAVPFMKLCPAHGEHGLEPRSLNTAMSPLLLNLSLIKMRKKIKNSIKYSKISLKTEQKGKNNRQFCF